MGESSSSSNNGMPLVGEIQVSPLSNLPPGYYDPNRITIGQMEGQSLFSTIEESIEKFQSHWSQVREFDCGDKVGEVSNMELFQTLQRHPTWGRFFKIFGEVEGTFGTLVMGKKFAEGGQAELYDVQIEWLSEFLHEQDLRRGQEWVLKVFKKGTSLRQLQALWPQGMLHFVADAQPEEKPSLVRFSSDIFGGTLLEDGRFAFLMVKEREDLQSLIDRQQSGPNIMAPLSSTLTMKAMYGVAYGMYQLHNRGIVHRDLKASNVLISKNGCFHVADYECSVGVVGTGFFRAPEILQACKDRTVDSRSELFTQAADVYSYGMICYEILAGKLPFEGHPLNDYDLVIKGARPEVPQYVDGWICKFLYKCWHSNPASRPSSKQVLKILEGNSVQCLRYKFRIQSHELELWETLKNSQGSWSILEKLQLLSRKVHIYLLYKSRMTRFYCFNRS